MQLNLKFNGKLLMIKDTSLYDKSFLEDLKTFSSEYDTLKLIDNKLIFYTKRFNGTKYLNTIDTSIIPEELPLNKKIQYRAGQNGITYLLKLKRENYTDIEYELLIDNKSVKSGKVILPGSFVFGIETNEDETGEMFPTTQYLEKDKCSTTLNVELDNAQRVRFSSICNGNEQNIKIPILKRI